MPDTKNREHLRPWSPASYRIEVEGLLEETWSDRFAGMRITSRKRADRSTVTCLTGRLMDQSELTGVLNGLAELHLPILLVNGLAELHLPILLVENINENIGGV
jgi:hypothetical protein